MQESYVKCLSKYLLIYLNFDSFFVAYAACYHVAHAAIAAVFACGRM